MSEVIKVTYQHYSTRFHIAKAMKMLEDLPVLSFDTEGRGVYTPEDREEAKELLKNPDISKEHKRLSLLVANNSGLSFPSLVRVTHFIFGTSNSHSIVFVCDNPQLELFIWDWISRYKGLLLVHNALFDLKLMKHRVNKYPLNYIDTSLVAKCLINHVSIWKAKIGLKELMGSFYDPRWSVHEDYEPKNLRDPDFLMYSATDGAATFKLWEMIQEMRK